MVKHEAMNPPQRCRIVPKAPPSISAKEAEANKKAEEFKARALTAAQKKTESASASAADKDSVQSKEKEPPPPPPFVPIAPSPPPLETTEAAAAVARMAKDSRKVGFTKEEAERFTAVAPCLAEVCISLSKEKHPLPWDETRDPAASAESFFRDSKTLGKSKDLEQAEAEVERLNSACVLFPESHTFGKTVRKELETAKASLTKLQKDSPTQDLTVASLEEVLAAHKRAAQVRQDRVQKGRELAQERRTQRAQLVATLRDELAAFAQSLEELEDGLTQDYERRNAMHEQFEEEVREKIRVRIADNGGQEAMDMRIPPQARPNGENGAEAHGQVLQQQRDAMKKYLEEAEKTLEEKRNEATKLADEVKKKHKDAEEAEQRLKLLEEQNTRLLQQKEAARASEEAKKEEEEERTKRAASVSPATAEVVLDVNLLPEFTCESPAPHLIAAFDHAYQVLEQVRWLAGVEVTLTVLNLTWADLLNMVGEQLKTVYLVEPPADVALHPQVLRMLHTALLRISAKLSAGSSDDERKAAEKRAEESLKAQAKRQRLA